MTDSSSDAWTLITLHRYSEAAAAYKHRLTFAPEDIGALGGYAMAALCLGRLETALQYYQRANELARLCGESHGAYQPHLCDIGTLLWLLDRRNEAIRILTDAVAGLSSGTIQFADAAGGVSDGLLLYYAGVSALNDKAQFAAGEFLYERLNNRTAWLWPGPVAAYLLGCTEQEVILAAACGSSELDECEARAKTDLLMRRRLVQAMFYMAVRRRCEGKRDECKALLTRCAALENPIVENEWYLARGEIRAGPHAGRAISTFGKQLRRRRDR